jgi:RNA polymerase sigma-70 factor (ECF subfamily)
MTGDSENDVDALMTRLADGDRAAFTPVFQKLWPSVLRLSMSILKNEADAADAAQQAMEKIFVRASDYDPRRAATPWALAIASWECRTIMRKRTRRREAPEEAIGDATGGADVEEDFAQRQLTLAAIDALGSLSETDRETLLSTFWEEAASAGGPTLRKRRERALTRFRAACKRLYGLG